MSSLFSTTTLLAPNDTYISSVKNITSASRITGSIYADQPGTLYIDQGGDGQYFDISTKFILDGLSTTTVDIQAICQFLRVRYVNGAVPQTTFRLYVDIRNPWGDFLANLAPSAGGAWVTLFYNPGPGKYEVVGRFDSPDGWSANTSAALVKNRNGKYASFAVIDATVSQETIQDITEQTPDAF